LAIPKSKKENDFVAGAQISTLTVREGKSLSQKKAERQVLVMKDQVSLRWADELSKALKAWCKEEGIAPSKLAKILDISEGAWYSITSGRSMSADITNYAKVYLWTGLFQADPRKVPQQRLGGALRGRTSVRAWTETEFSTWLSHSVAQKLLKAKTQSGDTPKLPETGTGVPTSVIEALGRLVPLLQYFAKMVAKEVASLLSDQANSGHSAEVLLSSIEKVLAGSVADRDSWFEKNKFVLVELLPLLEAMTLPSEAREKRLQLINRQKSLREA
jgi:hypothetical protein